MEAQGLQFERSGGMSAESDKRDGDEDGRRPRQAKSDRSGGAGAPRREGRGGGRGSSGSFQSREGGSRSRRSGRPGEGGPRAGSRGSGRYPKNRDVPSKGRDDDSRTGSRPPRPYRGNDSESSFRDRPKRRDNAAGGSFGERDDSRRTPRPGGGRFEGKEGRRPPRGSDRQGENRGARGPRREGSGGFKREGTERRGGGGSQRRTGSEPRGKAPFERREGTDSGGFKRDGAERRGGGGFQRRTGSEPRGKAPFERREGTDANTRRAGAGGRPPRREGTDSERGSAAPRGGFQRREGTRGGREGGRPGEGGFAARGGRRPEGRGRGSADRGRKPYGRGSRTPDEEPRPKKDPGPAVPADVTGDELDRSAKSELKTLPKELATEVARHLVMAGRLIDDDPDLAYQHTLAARRRAARVGVVREACGLAAYHAGLWSVALSELRAARRLTGQEAYLAIMADAERGLGRPERALDLARSDEARRLLSADAIEMRIVESGARRDLGQHGAAVLALQVPELKDDRLRPWSARLFYAYADALAEAGREEEATDWFARAAAADRDGETDAAERYAEIEGLDIIDDEDIDEG
jgi:hypothetical protein